MPNETPSPETVNECPICALDMTHCPHSSMYPIIGAITRRLKAVEAEGASLAMDLGKLTATVNAYRKDVLCAEKASDTYARLIEKLLDRQAKADAKGVVDRPKVVCLCGSTRFYAQFQEANYRETMAGKIVLSVGFYPHQESAVSLGQAIGKTYTSLPEMCAQKIASHGEEHGCTPEQKEELDALHFRKIEMADEVLILNVGGYIGNSTRNELNHARKLGKVVRFLEVEVIATPTPPRDIFAEPREGDRFRYNGLDREIHKENPPKNDEYWWVRDPVTHENWGILDQFRGYSGCLSTTDHRRVEDQQAGKPQGEYRGFVGALADAVGAIKLTGNTDQMVSVIQGNLKQQAGDSSLAGESCPPLVMASTEGMASVPGAAPSSSRLTNPFSGVEIASAENEYGWTPQRAKIRNAVKEFSADSPPMRRLEQRIAMFEGLLNRKNGLNAMTIEFRESDGRHYAHDETGKFVWSGDPVFNAASCAAMELRRVEFQARITALEAVLTKAMTVLEVVLALPARRIIANLDKLKLDSRDGLRQIDALAKPQKAPAA